MLTRWPVTPSIADVLVADGVKVDVTQSEPAAVLLWRRHYAECGVAAGAICHDVGKCREDFAA